MIISIKTEHGYLSWQPANAFNDATLQYRDSVGEWERFDVDGLQALAGVIAGLLKQAEPVKPPIVVNPTDPALSPHDQFFKWVEGKPFGQQTLLELEPTMKAAGWLLTPPNANGERTKVLPPGGPWTRVGFGEGSWQWLEQP